MEGLGLNLGYLIVQIVNFGILFLILRALVVRPILDLLERRKLKIAKGIEDAAIAAEARANAEEQAEQIIKNAQIEAARLVREATERAEVVEREIKATALTEAVQEREEMLKVVDKDREEMQGKMRDEILMLAVAAAERLIHESILQDPIKQSAILNEFFSGVRDGKLQIVKGRELVGSYAEVISALPLTGEEKEIVRKDLLPSLEGEKAVVFRQDTSILGGLVIRVGDRVVDGSVRGQLKEMYEELRN